MNEKIKLEESLKRLKHEFKQNKSNFDLAETNPKYDFSHLTQIGQVTWGPIQDGKKV